MRTKNLPSVLPLAAFCGDVRHTSKIADSTAFYRPGVDSTFLKREKENGCI